MGKMLTALVIIFAIELAMSLFITCYPGEGVTCEGKTYLFSLLVNPQDWSTNNLLSWLKDNVLLLGGVLTIIAGLTIFTKVDFVIYLGIAAVFYSFGQTLFQLWQQIANIGFFGDGGNVMASIFVGGLIIYFLIAVLDYARGRD